MGTKKQNGTKFKLWQNLKTQNSNCYRNQIVTKLQTLNCDKTQKLKKGEQTHIVTKVKNSICDKTQSIAKLKT